MTDNDLLKSAWSDGVRLEITPHGTLCIAGNRNAVNRWLPMIRERRDGLIGELLAFSFWWRLYFSCGGVLEVFSPSGNTREAIMKGYPEAVSGEPFALEHTLPDARLTVVEAAAIVLWLASIGERSQEIIDDVLAQCERSAEARGYYLRQVEGKPDQIKC